jgi:hypothetical protein
MPMMKKKKQKNEFEPDPEVVREIEGHLASDLLHASTKKALRVVLNEYKENGDGIDLRNGVVIALQDERALMLHDAVKNFLALVSQHIARASIQLQEELSLLDDDATAPVQLFVENASNILAATYAHIEISANIFEKEEEEDEDEDGSHARSS